MKEKLLKKTPEFWILSLFCISNLCVCWGLQLTGSDNPYAFLWNNSIVMAIVIIRYLLALRDVKKFPKPEMADIALIILTVFGIISTIFSTNIEQSIWGAPGRNEGIYSLVSYYFLFYCASKIKSEADKKSLIAVFLAVGVFSCIIGIISGYGVLDHMTATWQGRATIPFGNPNFFCTLCCMVSALGMGLILYSDKKKLEIAGYVILAVGIMSSLETNGSLSFCGNICAFLLIAFIELVLRRKTADGKTRGKQMLKLLYMILIYIALIVLCNLTRDGSFTNEMLANYEDAEAGWFHDSWFSGRMGAWKCAFRVFPDYWLHGAGVDCFQYAMVNPKSGWTCLFFDKAHNEYIQIMTTEGIFACITYIWFLFILFIQGIKKSAERIEQKNYIFMALFIAFFSYIAQAFFNISVVHVASYFWILCGLFYERKSNGTDENIDEGSCEDIIPAVAESEEVSTENNNIE